jgi:hypothetical protein
VLLIRRIGALALVAAALFVWFSMAPEAPKKLDHGSAVAAIESEDDGNNVLASGAPQQAVVNGWTSNDYLKLISEQLDANGSRQQVRDVRPSALLVLGVAGIALIAFTSPGPWRPARSTGPGPSAPVATRTQPEASASAAPGGAVASNGVGSVPTAVLDGPPSSPLGKHL